MLHVEIYRKSLRRRDLSVADAKEKESNAAETKDSSEEEEDAAAAASTGAIVNLMGTDASRISDFSALWFVILSAPIELAIGIYFLYQLMGMACIYGLLIMVFILPVNHFNSKYFAKTQDRLMKARDKRVSLMTEVLQGIRQIKFFAWETNWEKRVMEARNAELAQLAITYINGVFFSLVWQGYVFLCIDHCTRTKKKFPSTELPSWLRWSPFLYSPKFKATNSRLLSHLLSLVSLVNFVLLST